MKLVVAVSIAFTILISVTGCASDDDEAPVESRIKNSMGEEQEPQDIKDDYINDSKYDGDIFKDNIDDDIDDDIFKGMYEEKDSLSRGYRESNELINDNINSKIKVPTYNYVDEDIDDDIHDDDTIYDD